MKVTRKWAKSMKDAHEQLLECCKQLKAVGWLSRKLMSAKYEQAYRNMMDAIRNGSGWLEHGAGTDEERKALLKDQIEVEAYVRSLGFKWDHPWNKGNPRE